MYFFVIILIAVLPVAIVLASVYTLVKKGRRFWPLNLKKARVSGSQKSDQKSGSSGVLVQVGYEDNEGNRQRNVLEKDWVAPLILKRGQFTATILIGKNGEARLLITVVLQVLALVALTGAGIVAEILVYRHLLSAKIF